MAYRNGWPVVSLEPDLIEIANNLSNLDEDITHRSQIDKGLIEQIGDWPDTSAVLTTYTMDRDGRSRWALRVDWPLVELRKRIDTLLALDAADKLLKDIKRLRGEYGRYKGAFAEYVAFPEEALALSRQAVELAPQNPAVLLKAARVCDQLGDPACAVDWIEKALAAGYQIDHLLSNPIFDELRKHPEFERILSSQ